jgi:hypothetical protein
LLYNPLKIRKSSLSKFITRRFTLDIYILNLSIINEANLTNLFTKLPNRYIILLEDVNAMSSNRDVKTKDSHQIVAPSRECKPGKVSLFVILNVIDGVKL